MHIDASESRDIKHLFRKYPAIGGNHDRIKPQRSQIVLLSLIPKRLRSANLYAESLREHLNGRRQKLLSSGTNSVLARIHDNDLHIFMDIFKYIGGKFRRSHKRDTHIFPLFLNATWR